jgi:hypothetical protein
MAHRALQLLANGPTGLVNETCWSGVAGEEGRNEGSRYSPLRWAGGVGLRRVPRSSRREQRRLGKVAAASINPIDIMERSGLTKDFKPVSFPGVLGWDLSGTVVQVGPDVVGFSIGDKVLA